MVDEDDDFIRSTAICCGWIGGHYYSDGQAFPSVSSSCSWRCAGACVRVEKVWRERERDRQTTTNATAQVLDFGYQTAYTTSNHRDEEMTRQKLEGGIKLKLIVRQPSKRSQCSIFHSTTRDQEIKPTL